MRLVTVPGPFDIAPLQVWMREHPAELAYHALPSHLSFGVLLELGWTLLPYESADIPAGSLILVPDDLPSLRLRVIVDLLLGPHGCPWDREQTHESLRTHLIEEAYEVIEAIDRGDVDELKEELGDLLLQPVLHAQMEAREGQFNFDDVAQCIGDKLVRRHPHVFAGLGVSGADEVLKNWDQIKKSEKAGKESGQAPSILGGVPASMPALLRAQEISKRAARAGFEWPDVGGVFDKLNEELNELQDAIVSGAKEAIESEIGDLLFTVVNIARWQKVNSEEALRQMVNRFTTRFEAMEQKAQKPLKDLTPDEWDALWVAAKASLSAKKSL